MKQKIVLNVYTRCVIAEDASELPEGAKREFVHPMYDVYIVKHVFSVAGRADEIRHAALVAVQARGEHAGELRYANAPSKRTRKAETISPRQMRLFESDD